MNHKQVSRQADELLRLESRYCSWGDTVHYSSSLPQNSPREMIWPLRRRGGCILMSVAQAPSRTH